MTVLFPMVATTDIVVIIVRVFVTLVGPAMTAPV